jgi:hypothetical protein
VVLAHAGALLADDSVTFVAEGDLRDPAGILASPEVRTRLDWGQAGRAVAVRHLALLPG